MYNDENENVNAQNSSGNEMKETPANDIVGNGEDFRDDGDDFDGENGESTSDTNNDEDYDENDVSDIHQPAELLSRRAMRAENVKQRCKAFKSFTKSKLFKIPVAVICAIIAAVVVVYAVCVVTLPTDTALRNVYIENVSVGGLSYDNILNSIKNTYLLENKSITLFCDGQLYTVNGDEVLLTALPEETAKMAFEYGKSGNMLKDGFTAFTLLFKKRVIVPSASFDEEKMREKITEFGNQIFGERRNHYVEIKEDGKSVVWPGETGYDGNCDAAISEIVEAVKNGHFDTIAVSLAKAAPDELTVGDFDGAVYADPVDAHFELTDGEIKVIAETNGRYINKEEAASLLLNVKEGGGPVEIPFYYSYPSITSDELGEKLFANSMASYSTSYASSGSNRASNVARAASLINGKILMPGDVFSFNDTVGKRTVANGFSTAPEYVDGKTVDGIGGGTCQVSSTLYNAVIYADLEIVTRTNHMFAVSYVPNGQDATVADSGPDFKFKNNTAYPIKIAAYTGGGQITVSIIGTNWKPAHSVKISSHSNARSNGDVYVSTTRTVTANGEVIKSESLPSSLYKKHSEEASSQSSSSSSSSSGSSSSSSSSGSSSGASSSSDSASGTAASSSQQSEESASSSADSSSSSESSETSQSGDDEDSGE